MDTVSWAAEWRALQLAERDATAEVTQAIRKARLPPGADDWDRTQRAVLEEGVRWWASAATGWLDEAARVRREAAHVRTATAEGAAQSLGWLAQRWEQLHSAAETLDADLHLGRDDVDEAGEVCWWLVVDDAGEAPLPPSRPVAQPAPLPPLPPTGPSDGASDEPPTSLDTVRAAVHDINRALAAAEDAQRAESRAAGWSTDEVAAFMGGVMYAAGVLHQPPHDTTAWSPAARESLLTMLHARIPTQPHGAVARRLETHDRVCAAIPPPGAGGASPTVAG
jgi:hypothetical protein